MQLGPKKFFKPDPNPKNSPQQCKKAPNLAKLKTNRQGYTSKTKVDCLHRLVTKMFLNLNPTPQRAKKK